MPLRFHVACLLLVQLGLGGSTGWAQPSGVRSAGQWLDEAYRQKAAGDPVAAATAFQAARSAGADRQLVALELGYLAVQHGDMAQACAEFERATLGADRERAAQAKLELAAIGGATAQFQRAPDANPRAADALRARGWLDYAYRRKAAGDLAEAAAAVRAAVRAGADRQRASLEFGFIAALRNQPAVARVAFDAAAKGADPKLVAEAERQLSALGAAPATSARHVRRKRRSAQGSASGHSQVATGPANFYLDRGYRLKRERNPIAAIAAFEVAKATGADPQLIDLELGYLAADRGAGGEARAAFERAASGPDPQLAAEARARLGADRRDADTDPALWADLYVEAFGSTRVAGPQRTTNLVPTVRARLLYGPLLSVDLHGYVLGEVTRDLASQAADADGLPIIYSDNKALFAAGALLRLWAGRAGIFAQIGPAIELVDATEQRVAIDGRVGAFVGVESPACWPEAGQPSALRTSFCGDIYAEVTYLSRFDHDVVAFARSRTGLGFAVTGPVLWQAVAEARAGMDSNGDYYNNFADVGVGPAARLLWPFHAELMLGVHGGSYFGRSNEDPAPSPLSYADIRLQAATYVEF